MRSFLKATIERMLGNSKWLEPSSNQQEVHSLLRILSPVATNCPLIRLGSAGDGGYLAPDDLEGIAVSVSPGVSTEVGFDLEMARRGIEVYMADASVAGPPVENPRFHFSAKFLDVFEDENNIRLDTLCSSIPDRHSGDRILQMDIEGAEYRVLLDASEEVLSDFRIMIIEFHHLDRMFAHFPLTLIRATFQKLLRSHYIVHIHPNNVCPPRRRGEIAIPPVAEFTFYRKDRAQLEHGTRLEFPHELDNDNLPENPGYALPACWH